MWSARQGLWLTVLFFRLCVGLQDCSQAVIDTGSDIVYRAYEGYVGQKHDDAVTFCNSICADTSKCRLAVGRTSTSITLMWSRLQYISRSVAYAGLDYDGTSVRSWIDGRTCSPSSSSDSICYGNVDTSTAYLHYVVSTSLSNKLLNAGNQQGSSAVCEFPGNNITSIAHFLMFGNSCPVHNKHLPIWIDE
jgi:hypothetical protein